MIKAEKLSKQYILSHEDRHSYVTLRDIIAGGAVGLWKRMKKPFEKKSSDSKKREEFWALKDIDLEVARGERIGIIGRNGAGKSTLLKIISKITEPTRGKLTVAGRTASLLEVGTGFHPELTGRENIFLNGAILGMTQNEIRLKFDEIVSFAEIERFLDTPVKRYSSGMYVRLAFAIAAHLEPAILLVDEVLAVGDSQFQKKCIGKMEDISSKQGRTVLFVSHNMSAIRALCTKCLLLSSGSNEYFGDVSAAIQRYVTKRPDEEATPIADRKRKSAVTLRAKIMDFTISTEDGLNPHYIDSRKPFTVRFTVLAFDHNTRVSPQFIIGDGTQNLIYVDAASLKDRFYMLNKGITEIECDLDATFLYAGDYNIECGLAIPNQELLDWVYARSFTVRELDPYNTGFNLRKNSNFGVFNVNHKWKEPVFSKE